MRVASSLFTVTEIDLVYRNKQPPSERPIIRRSQNARDLFMETWDMNKIEIIEQFKIMLLNRRGAVLGISHIGTGGLHECTVDQRVIFATALKAGASSLILAHNHPSGDPKPGNVDIAFTKQIKEAGKLLDIRVDDHLILTPREYFSMGDRGMMP